MNKYFLFSGGEVHVKIHGGTDGQSLAEIRAGLI